MNEFGQPKPLEEEILSEKTPGEQQQQQQLRSNARSPDTPAFDRDRMYRPSPPPSPAPFAHYAEDATNRSSRPGQPPFDMQMTEKQLEKEEDGAGCCKCIVM